MPELPEVEVLVRRLRPRLVGKTIRDLSVRRVRVVAPATERELARALKGARFVSVQRRAKFLVFMLRRGRATFTLLGHLGMSGHMYVAPCDEAEPKHAAVVLWLGTEKFIYRDTRYFGRLTLDTTPLQWLGPEPLERDFKLDAFARALRKSSQSIKVKLLDQCLVAGLGNIYATEALFEAGIAPQVPARRLSDDQIARLWKAIPKVLAKAIRFGATLGDTYTDRLAVYDRAGKPCARCRTPIRRIVQAARSTYFCPTCQRRR